MDGTKNIECPVCTLYLRPGMSLESHLTTHPSLNVLQQKNPTVSATANIQPSQDVFPPTSSTASYAVPDTVDITPNSPCSIISISSSPCSSIKSFKNESDQEINHEETITRGELFPSLTASTSQTNRDYLCDCGENFPSASKLKYHKEIHEKRPKSCTYCNEKFIHMSSLTRHIRRNHNKHYLPNNREGENVECRLCKKVLLRTSLKAHLKTHSGSKKHKCSTCNKEFTTKWNLKYHQLTHADPKTKPFRCETCQSTFVRESEYNSHMNSHRGKRPFTCNTCGSTFIGKYNYLRHVKDHAEEKSHICEVCNKRFNRFYYLTEHMRVHTGVRPFSCDICGRTSTTSSNHNKHMKIHQPNEHVMVED